MSENIVPDYSLYTDGSGHINGFGGWAALVLSHKTNVRNFRMGAMSGTSVDRMEMTAVVEGLHTTWQLALQELNLQKMTVSPTVIWYCDRESLVKSALREYGRSNSHDLWSLYENLELQLKIFPVHVVRETESVFFQEVDLHASTAYQMIKDYVTSIEGRITSL